MASIEQTAELNELLAKQNKLLESQNRMIKGQLSMMKQLSDVFNNMGYDQRDQELQNLNETLEKSVEEVEKFGTSSQNTMENVQHAADAAGKAAGGMMGRLDKLAKYGAKLAPVALAFDGFIQGAQLSVNAFSSLASMGSTLVGSLTNVAFSIITMPFKMLQGLINMTDGGGGGGLRQALEDIRKEFGDLRTGASEAIRDISKSMSGRLAETGLSSRRIFGNLAERLKTVASYAQNMGNAFDLVRDSFVDNAERVGAYIKGLGQTEELQRSMAQTAIRTGTSLQEVGREITTFAYQMGDAFNINGLQIGRDIGAMMDDFDNFGNLGVQTLSEISVYARQLGVDFKDLLGVVDKFDNFEDAAQSAAQLSQAFGLQLDTLELVNAQDPAERIEMLRKSFFAAGKSIENMTRQERALLAQQTGLDQKTASLVFSLENQGKSYADIQKQGDATKKKQLSQAEAMEKLSGSIERLVKSGGAMSGGFFDRFLQGFSMGIRRTGEFRKVMRNLRKSLRIVYRAGIQVGRSFMKLFPGIKDMTKALGDLFNPRRFGAQMKIVVDIFKRFFKGDLDFKGFAKALKEGFTGFFDAEGKAGKAFLSGAKKFFKKLTHIFMEGLEFAADGLAEGIKALTGFIINPDEALNAATGAGEGFVGFFNETVLQPLIKFWNSDARKKLFEALENLFTVVIDKFKTWFFKFMKDNWVTIFAVAFGPAVIGGIARGAIGGLGVMLAKGISGALGRAVGSIQGGLEKASQAQGGAGGLSPRQGRSLSSGASAVADVVQTARKSRITPADIPRLATLAAVITGGMIGFAAAVGLLVLGVRAANITPGEIGTTVLFMTGATLIAAEMGLLMAGLSVLGGFLSGTGPLILVGAAAVFTAGALIGPGMSRLIDSVSGISLSQAITTAAIVGAAALIVGGLGLILAALTGAGILGLAAPLAFLGSAALVGAVEASGMISVIAVDEFRRLSVSSLMETGLKIGAVGLIMLGIGVLGAGLAQAGGLALIAGPLAIVGSAGLKAVIVGSATIASVAITTFAGVSAGDLKSTGSKIGSMTLIIGGLALVGAEISTLGLISLLPGIESFFKVGLARLVPLMENITGSIGAIIVLANQIPASEETRASLRAFGTIIEMIGNFAGIVGSLAGEASLGLADVFREGNPMVVRMGAMAGLMQALRVEMVNIVQEVLRITADVSAEQINQVQGVASAVQGLGTFASGLLGALDTMPDALGDDESFAGGLRSLTSFFRSISSELQLLINSVAVGIMRMTTQKDFDAEKISSAASAITGILTSLTNMATSVLSIAQEMASGDGGGGLGKIREFMTGVVGGIASIFANENFLESISRMVQTVSAVGASISEQSIKGINNFGAAIGSISNAMVSISQNAASINSGVMDQVKAGVSAMIETINELETDLGSIGTVNINSELRDLGNRLDLGDTTRVSIQKGDLTLRFEMKVVMEADKLAEALELHGGVVRDK